MYICGKCSFTICISVIFPISMQKTVRPQIRPVKKKLPAVIIIATDEYWGIRKGIPNVLRGDVWVHITSARKFRVQNPGIYDSFLNSKHSFLIFWYIYLLFLRRSKLSLRKANLERHRSHLSEPPIFHGIWISFSGNLK